MLGICRWKLAYVVGSLKAEVAKVEYVDIVHDPIPLILIVEGFGVNVCALSVRLGVDRYYCLPQELLVDGRNVDRMSPVQMAHCGVAASLHDADHSLVVLVEDDL